MVAGVVLWVALAVIFPTVVVPAAQHALERTIKQHDAGASAPGPPPRRHAGTVRVARRRRGDRALTSAGGDGIAAAARTPRGERWGCERVIRTHDPDVWPACPVRIPGSHA
ncbi:hypothetical protein Y034_733 [Burkholderia pseudomallei MSHR449]|nr:hypothetical protein BG17_1419 [Burkholderia pseudomallei MSHR491]KGW83171.1 hypothetical protein Y034_733 [Burkholderia pseudomallei MSHR449]